MVIFTVECFSAIIAKGLWQHDEAYLKVKICLKIFLTMILGGNAEMYNMLYRPSEHLEFSRLHHRDDRVHRYLLVNDAGLCK